MLLHESIVFGKAHDPLVDAQIAEPRHTGNYDASWHENARSPGPQRTRPVYVAGPSRPDRLFKVVPSLRKRDPHATVECVREVLACASHLALVFMGQAKRRNYFAGS